MLLKPDSIIPQTIVNRCLFYVRMDAMSQGVTGQLQEGGLVLNMIGPGSYPMNPVLHPLHC